MRDPTVPQLEINTEQQIDIDIAPTDATIVSQGYTYNQAGFTYNQAGVMYGGISQVNQDVAPVFFNDTATLLVPEIDEIIDVGTPFIPPESHEGMLIGILGLTYPS